MSNSDIENAEPGTKPGQPVHRGFRWYSFLFGPPFKLIGFFYRTYHANRVRLAALVSKPRVSSGLRTVMVLTLVLWIATWLIVPNETPNRFTDAIQENFGSLGAALED